MRKTMKKEVTITTCAIAKMEMVDGKPIAIELPKEVLLGNVTLEKAQQQLNKKLGFSVTVFEVQADTQTYEMDVEEFIKVATIVKAEEQIEADLQQA